MHSLHQGINGPKEVAIDFLEAHCGAVVADAQDHRPGRRPENLSQGADEVGLPGKAAALSFSGFGFQDIASAHGRGSPGEAASLTVAAVILTFTIS